MSDPPSYGNDKITRTASSVPVEARKTKIGHRRVNVEGTVTYKKKTTSDIQKAIQLGITISVGSINNKPKRDVLLKDFGEEEMIAVPKIGSRITPAHVLSDFQFRTYAPIAFRFFREIFKVDMCEFMDSICTQEMTELINPGASGSIFYRTQDDEFIIKTVQKKEAKFLQKLLPEYYLNLMQHPRTLLPKFYGLYSYETMGKNIRFVIMNNLLPSVTLHEKYDLKGSTFKRYASKKERAKLSPTLKDLDFKENHPNGLTLDADTYDALMQTIQRDCTVLESFSIMDYSLLLGVHNVSICKTDDCKRISGTPVADMNTSSEFAESPVGGGDEHTICSDGGGRIRRNEPARSSSHGKSVKRIAAYSTPMEAILPDTTSYHHVTDDDTDLRDLPAGGIPARNARGEKLYLYLGIIDILQSYQINKKLEHSIKAILHEPETISVTNPAFYKKRFEEFFSKMVFRRGSPAFRPKRRASKPAEPERSISQRVRNDINSTTDDKNGDGSLDATDGLQTPHMHTSDSASSVESVNIVKYTDSSDEMDSLTTSTSSSTSTSICSSTSRKTLSQVDD